MDSMSQSLLRYMKSMYVYMLEDYLFLSENDDTDFVKEEEIFTRKFFPLRYPSITNMKVRDVLLVFKEKLSVALSAAMPLISSLANSRNTYFDEIYTEQLYPWDCGLACCIMVLKFLKSKEKFDKIYSHPTVKSSPLWSIDLYGECKQICIFILNPLSNFLTCIRRYTPAPSSRQYSVLHELRRNIVQSVSRHYLVQRYVIIK